MSSKALWTGRRAKADLATSACILSLLLATACSPVNRKLTDIRAKAAKGDAQSQAELGDAFTFGRYGMGTNFLEGAEWYRKAAEQNYAPAQNSLAVCYEKGRGVAQDAVEAVKWYRKAAQQNHSQAQANLALCYEKGRGVARDPVQAVQWCRKAAEQNNAHAQCGLGLFYSTGEGVSQDSVEAVKWFRKAADRNDALAQCALAICYAEGRGLATNEGEAAKWFRKAAEQGYSKAQASLGESFAKGRGVAKDPVEAVKWLRKAADQNDARAQNNLAWILATSGNRAIRDGSKAMFFAERAVAATNRKAATELDSLASAYAEAGQFGQAVVTEKEALALPQTPENRSDRNARLKLFEARMPYRTKD